MEWHITINQQPTELACVKQRIGELLERQKLPYAVIENCQLIAEEVLVNIIHYGHPPEPIGLSLKIADPHLTMTFVDGGTPFNPLAEVAPPDLDAEDDARAEGGLGFFLVQQLADAVKYAYRDGQNVLTVFLRSLP
jgi:sigma-B regulation protein RsbU (phosphoserine phosphatase)